MLRQEMYQFEPKQGWADAINEAYRHFMVKHGYRPTTIYSSFLIECKVTRLKVVYRRGILPYNFWLGDVVDRRTPIILKGKRRGIYD